jgi:hypothetical protein
VSFFSVQRGAPAIARRSFVEKEYKMRRKLLAAILMLGLALPEAFLAQQNPANAVQPAGPPAAARPAQPAGQAETPQTQRPQPTYAQQRSYEREVHGRRHRRISKNEWIFLGAVAGTSMGIGALAAGAHGLAIGAIVGGWGAFAAHKLWRHIS